MMCVPAPTTKSQSNIENALPKEKVPARIPVGDCQTTEYVLQPGPDEEKDIWTTSVYCYCPGGGGPGGGLNNDELIAGGWGDSYHALLEFDLSHMPSVAQAATLELFNSASHVNPNWSGTTTALYLDRITEWWDWRVQGTGADRERLWWTDRPSTVQWLPAPLPAPAPNKKYSIDITSLYNAWQSDELPNFGLQLRPVNRNNQWSKFFSANYMDNPNLRPRLVVHACSQLAPFEDQPAPGHDDPSRLVSLAHLWEWNEGLGRFAPPGPEGVLIDPTKPTYLLTHGWDGTLDGEGVGSACAEAAYALSSMGCAVRERFPEANLLAWDWADGANPNKKCDLPDELIDAGAEAAIQAIAELILTGGVSTLNLVLHGTVTVYKIV